MSGEGLIAQLRRYLDFKSGGWFRYCLEGLFNYLLGWIPGLVGIFLRWVFFRLIISGSGWMVSEPGVKIFGSRWIEIGSGVYLGEGVFLQGRPGGLKIGDKVRIMPGAYLNVYNYRGIETSGIEIGEEAVIGVNVIITGQGGVKIGRKVIIAPGVKIMPVEHNYQNPQIPIKDQGIQAKGIVIEEGAWVGAGAIILDGVEIGKNAVVGAGSVVVDSVPAHSVAIGNPARIIKAPEGIQV